MDKYSRSEKIELVKKARDSTLKEIGKYAPYISNDYIVDRIQDKLPKIPIYGFETIIHIMGGFYEIPKKHQILIDELIEEIKEGSDNNVSNKFIALTVRDKLPKKPIYEKATIKLIIIGQYK